MFRGNRDHRDSVSELVSLRIAASPGNVAADQLHEERVENIGRGSGQALVSRDNQPRSFNEKQELVDAVAPADPNALVEGILIACACEEDVMHRSTCNHVALPPDRSSEQGGGGGRCRDALERLEALREGRHATDRDLMVALPLALDGSLSMGLEVVEAVEFLSAYTRLGGYLPIALAAACALSGSFPHEMYRARVGNERIEIDRRL